MLARSVNYETKDMLRYVSLLCVGNNSGCVFSASLQKEPSILVGQCVCVCVCVCVLC